jgi:hypothetical protein
VSRLGLDRWDLAAVACLAACFFVVGRASFQVRPLGDMDFHIEARALASAIRGDTPWDEVGITKAAGPVAYYTIPYLLVPRDSADEVYWRVAVAWTAMWMGVALLVLRRTAARIGGSTAGLLAVALTLLNPFNVYYAFAINAENPAYLGAVALTAAWFGATLGESRGRSPWREAIALSLGISAVVLCRPNSALMLPLLVLTAIVLARRGHRGGLLLGRSVAIAILTIALTQLAVGRLPGRADAGRQGSYLAYVMFHGSFQYRTETWDWRFWDVTTRADSADFQAWTREATALKERAEREHVPLASLQYEWIERDFLAHPFVRLKMACVRLLSLHVALVNSVRSDAFAIGPLHGPVAYWTLHLAINALSIAVLCCALVFAFRAPGGPWTTWPVWAPWLALLAFHVVTYAEPRYLLPTRPGMIVAAAALLASESTRFRLFERLRSS